MTKRSPEFFRDYLRVLGGRLSYVDSARALNISEDWIYKVLRASKAASTTPELPSVFLFEAEEDDGEPRWFHDHVRSAVSNSIEAIEAAARSRALHGTYTTAKFQGRTVYQIDPDLEELGFEGPEAYRRDENGKPVPEQVWLPPSTDLVLGILAAHSKRYRKATSAGNTMNVNLPGGVQVIGRKSAPQISAPLPVLEIVQDPRPLAGMGAIAEPPADFAELDDMTVTDTPPDPIDDDDEPLTPAPAPVPTSPSYSTPTPPEYASPPQTGPLAPPRRALSPLEQDLLARLSGTPEQRSAPVIPSSLNWKA